MIPRIIVMIGPSNSGKSTWCHEFIRENENFIRVNRDSLRRMLQFSVHMNKRGEKLVSRLINDSVDEALMMGYNVIIDNMHCTMEYIKEIANYWGDVADIEFKVMPDISLEELLSRNELRALEEKIPAVPDWCIERAFNNFNNLKKEFDFATIKKKRT